MSAAREDLQSIVQIAKELYGLEPDVLDAYGDDIGEALTALAAVEDHIHLKAQEKTRGAA